MFLEANIPIVGSASLTDQRDWAGTAVALGYHGVAFNVFKGPNEKVEPRERCGVKAVPMDTLQATRERVRLALKGAQVRRGAGKGEKGGEGGGEKVGGGEGGRKGRGGGGGQGRRVVCFPVASGTDSRESAPRIERIKGTLRKGRWGGRGGRGKGGEHGGRSTGTREGAWGLEDQEGEWKGEGAAGGGDRGRGGDGVAAASIYKPLLDEVPSFTQLVRITAAVKEEEGSADAITPLLDDSPSFTQLVRITAAVEEGGPEVIAERLPTVVGVGYDLAAVQPLNSDSFLSACFNSKVCAWVSCA
ncbi:unnamed protein product [Closterium sp. NIES-65]|nr:unnamed protein product [Closterium sp. NIES-65]